MPLFEMALKKAQHIDGLVFQYGTEILNNLHTKNSAFALRRRIGLMAKK